MSGHPSEGKLFVAVPSGTVGLRIIKEPFPDDWINHVVVEFANSNVSYAAAATPPSNRAGSWLSWSRMFRP